MVQRTLTRERTKQAYTLVDLSRLHKETRKDIIEDAYGGGGIYGIRVVEEHINGPAVAPVYGFYNDGVDAEKWDAAKKQLSINGSAVEIIDPQRVEALRGAAVSKAASVASRVRAAEAKAVGDIVGDNDEVDDDDYIAYNPSADRDGGEVAEAPEPETPDAEPEEAATTEPEEEAETPRKLAKRNKAPR